MLSFTRVFLRMFYSTNLPTSVFFDICSANCSLAKTKAKPYLLASFFVIFVLDSLLPPITSTEAGLLGLFALILNFNNLAISSRISSLEP